MRKEIRTEDAIGLILAHDLTKIVPGEFKGAAFRKGHVIREEDVASLLSIGKEHIFVLTIEPGELHENDAAIRLASAVSGPSLIHTTPHEGKVTLKAPYRGVAKVNVDALYEMNRLGDIAIVTKRSGSFLQQGDAIAGIRAIPLVIAEEKIAAAEKIGQASQPVIDVVPLKSIRVGVVTTGSEVAKGRITDRFGPVVRQKLSALDCEMVQQRIVGDETDAIVTAMQEFVAEGVEMIVVTGGMSVDPDDRTPGAIRQFATEVVSYGMPVLPGSMTMLAYAGSIPIFGLPACVIYDETTVFDLLLPRVLAGERVTQETIAALGHGGLL